MLDVFFLFLFQNKPFYTTLRKRTQTLRKYSSRTKLYEVFEKCGNPCNKRNKNLKILGIWKTNARALRAWALLFPIFRANNLVIRTLWLLLLFNYILYVTLTHVGDSDLAFNICV